RETHDAARADASNGVRYHLPDASAFDDDVGLESDACDRSCVVGRAKGAHEFRFRSRLGTIKDVDLQSALLAEQGSEKTNRPCARNQHGVRLPEGALTDCGNLLPS